MTSNDGLVLGPEEEVQPGARAIHCHRDTYQLVARVDCLLRNILRECRVHEAHTFNLAILVVIESHVSVFVISACLSCINVNVLDLLVKVCCIPIGYLSSKLNLLAIFERNLDADQFVRLAAAVVFRFQTCKLPVRSERFEQLKVFPGAREAETGSDKSTNRLQLQDF